MLYGVILRNYATDLQRRSQNPIMLAFQPWHAVAVAVFGDL
jgi:hypothetical protein